MIIPPFFILVNSLGFSFLFLAFAALGQIGIMGNDVHLYSYVYGLALHVLSSGSRKGAQGAHWFQARRMENRRKGRG